MLDLLGLDFDAVLPPDALELEEPRANELTIATTIRKLDGAAK